MFYLDVDSPVENQTKRGIVGGDVIVQPLSDKAQEEFGLYCEAHIVPLTQLYGGKIAAAILRGICSFYLSFYR